MDMRFIYQKDLKTELQKSIGNIDEIEEGCKKMTPRIKRIKEIKEKENPTQEELKE